jgi:hypothetical protein
VPAESVSVPLIVVFTVKTKAVIPAEVNPDTVTFLADATLSNALVVGAVDVY